MIPGRTEFATVGAPGTPAELSNWLHGGFMSSELLTPAYLFIQ